MLLVCRILPVIVVSLNQVSIQMLRSDTHPDCLWRAEYNPSLATEFDLIDFAKLSRPFDELCLVRPV